MIVGLCEPYLFRTDYRLTPAARNPIHHAATARVSNIINSNISDTLAKSPRGPRKEPRSRYASQPGFPKVAAGTKCAQCQQHIITLIYYTVHQLRSVSNISISVCAAGCVETMVIFGATINTSFHLRNPPTTMK